jgi:hypothetical protein
MKWKCKHCLLFLTQPYLCSIIVGLIRVPGIQFEMLWNGDNVCNQSSVLTMWS